MNNNDMALIANMQSGDHRAFRQLYDKYHNEILVYVDSLIHNSHEAKDIVQEVFVSLWEHRCKLRNVYSVEAYLKVTARNKVLNAIRDRNIRPICGNYTSSGDAQDVSVTDYSHLEYSEFERLMSDMINKLPKSQRGIFIMSRFEQKSHKEISRSLNLSHQTVKNALSTALRTLRLKLEKSSHSDIMRYRKSGGVKNNESTCYKAAALLV